MSVRPARWRTYVTHPARVPPSSRLVVMPTISTPGQPRSIASAHASSGSPPKSVSRCTSIREIIPGPTAERGVWQPGVVLFAAPRAAEPTPDERELLLRYLHRQREEVVATATGLTDEQARWTPVGG